PEHAIVVDEPVSNVVELRQTLRRRLPEAAERLGDRNLNVAVNGEMVLSGEAGAALKSGDRVTVFPMIAGG
ncbi:MAG: MoaD/ThiS family protein, partial [Rhodocyclaceae bacterium]|nr:MoaD/ThiS family protein [Rhodocyclaceae bacterium]